MTVECGVYRRRTQAERTIQKASNDSGSWCISYGDTTRMNYLENGTETTCLNTDEGV